MQTRPMSQESAEKFVALWQTHNVSAIVKKMGISRQRVHQIAIQMREAGIPLRQNNTRPNSYAAVLDIEKLKNLAEILSKTLEGG